MSAPSLIRSLMLAAPFVAAAGTASAQAAAKKHPPVCAAAVRVYHEKADIPVPHDTLTLPPGPPVRVSSPEEAEAAELAIRERAGVAGANAILQTTETVDSGDGNVQMRRSITALYVPADSARAVAACKK